MSIEGLSINGVAHQYVYDALEGEPSLNISFKTRPGFIDVVGNQGESDSDRQEVYTNKLPCFPGDTVTLSFTWESLSEKWETISYFDENGRFISRSNNFYSGAGTSYTTTVTMPANAYYYAVSWRTYGNSTLNILYNGSVYDIRNRIDKGLVSEELFGEFDTGNLNYNVNAGEVVLRLGYRPCTGLIKTPYKRKVTFTKIGDYSGTIGVHLSYYNAEKVMYMPGSEFVHVTASGVTLAVPDGAEYIRACFDSGNMPNNTTSITAEEVRQNVRMLFDVVDETLLTPIIGGRGSFPVFNSADNTLTIYGDTILFKDGQPVIVGTNTPGETHVIDLTAISSSAKKVFYNITTSTFEVHAWSTTVDMSNKILVCVLRWNLQYYPNSVSINCPYYLDGKLYGIDTTAEVDFDAIAWAFNENVKGVNHRGYNTVAPENTLPAYKLSKQNGFKYVECDVSMTSDRVPVLLHDDTINRTARNADGTTISETINITSITYEQALTYDFGIWKSSTYAGTKIPTFEQFILLCRNLGLHPYIELKSGGGYTEAEIQGLVDMVDKYGMSGKVSWISFSSTLLTYVKNYDSEARLGFVVGALTSDNITTAQGLKTTTNEVFLDVSSITDALAETCAAADIPVEVWTVNSTSGITGLNPYVSGVTSDNLIAAKVLYEANI